MPPTTKPTPTLREIERRQSEAYAAKDVTAALAAWRDRLTLARDAQKRAGITVPPCAS